MTYEIAIEALITAGYLSEADRARALSALSSTSTDFTYPSWAQALVDAKLVPPSDASAAAKVMEQAAAQLEKTGSQDDLDQSLENAGIL
jgi:hypothetical protein